MSPRRTRTARMLEPQHQADRLRRLRIVAGKLHKKDGKPYTTGEMADKLGIVQQRYSAYENRGDQPSPTVLAAMRDQFDITADWVLLGDDDNMPHYLLSAIQAVTEAELRAIMKRRG